MTLWDGLRRLFGHANVPDHDYIESGLHFPELDLPRMRNRLALAERGKNRGSRNEPPSTQTALDEVENSVATTIEAEARLAHGKLVENLTAYDARLSALKIGTRLAQLISVADGTSADFRARIRGGLDLLYHLHQSVVDIHGEFDRFRREHQLERPPRYPLSKLWHYGLALLLIFIESPLNGSFLARGDPMGYLGGVTQAVIIAAINVLTGLTTGRVAVPNTIHRQWWRRIAGMVGMLVLGAFVLAFNLVVAHYRAALGGENPSQAERLALAQFLASPLAIPDVLGWLLFILGVGFATLAAVDGWKMDDPYPGYGAVARRKQEAQDEYSMQKAELAGELEQVRDDAVARMDSLTAEVEVRQGQYQSIRKSRIRLQDLFRRHHGYLEQCGNDLLSTYRQANREARSAPEPDHFRDRWHLPADASSDQEFDGPADDDSLRKLIANAFEEIRVARHRIEAEYQDAMRQYETIDEVIRGGIRGSVRQREA